MKLENEKIYIHRERGLVLIPVEKAKIIFSEVSRRERVELSNFIFSVKNLTKDKNIKSEFGSTPIYIYWKEKYFGRLHWETGKIIFDTKSGLNKRLKELEECFLEKKIIKRPFKIKHSYVEVCTRFPREAYSLALKKMKLVKRAFRTNWTHCHIKEHDSIKEPYLYIVKNLIFNQYQLNLKVYLAYKIREGKYNPDKIIGEDSERKPKIEVQISRIDSLDVAKKEAIPIILAFLESIKTTSLEMIEGDYELIRFKGKYLKPYQQILAHLIQQETEVNLFIFEKKIVKIIDQRRINILQEIIRKPLNKKEIGELFNISKNTIESDLKNLIKRGLIYSRGRNGIANMYAFDWVGYRNNRPPETLPVK